MTDSEFSRHVRRLVLAWVALIALMSASLGSAYLSLGLGNLIAGLAIAAIKSAIVVVIFMRLAASSTVIRLVAAAGLAFWLVLAGLSGLDYMTRSQAPAPYQKPDQVHPPPRPSVLP